MSNNIHLDDIHDPPPVYQKDNPDTEKLPPYPIDTTAGRWTSATTAGAGASSSNPRLSQEAVRTAFVAGEPTYPASPTTDNPVPAWLARNLHVTNITVYLNWIPGIINLAFAQLMYEDLKDDNHYIAKAYEPWDPYAGSEAQGRYHAECRQLFQWSQVLTAAGALTLTRVLFEMLPIKQPSDPEHEKRGLSNPSIVFAIRTFFSAAPAILHLVCAILLCTSRLMAGPPGYDSYRPQYSVCLASVLVAFVIGAHQSMSTGVAAWKLRAKAGP